MPQCDIGMVTPSNESELSKSLNEDSGELDAASERSQKVAVAVEAVEGGRDVGDVVVVEMERSAADGYASLTTVPGSNRSSEEYKEVRDLLFEKGEWA